MSGGEEWLRICLEQPPQLSVTETGGSGLEVRGAEERCDGLEAAPIHEEEGHSISKRSRETRRPHLILLSLHGLVIRK